MQLKIKNNFNEEKNNNIDNNIKSNIIVIALTNSNKDIFVIKYYVSKNSYAIYNQEFEMLSYALPL